MARPTRVVLPITMLALGAGATHAQVFTASYDTSTLDRWNYPFNGSPGTRLELPAFGAIELPGFDDHDAQVLIGFDTSGDIPAGLGAERYRVVDATVTLTVLNGNDFPYDDTYDSYTTYGSLGTDPDAGRPINLFLTGYRDGFDQTTYGESTAFGFNPDVEPAQGSRRAYAAIFEQPGVATDVSNNLKEQFEAVPLAIGTTDTLNPGDSVPADTTFEFSFSPCGIGTNGELARMLDLGEVRFSVTNLIAAVGGPDGGDEQNYPIFYPRENPVAQLLGYTPTLELTVRVGIPGDLDGNGSVGFEDVNAFVTAFSSGDLIADLDGDCTVGFADLNLFIDAFAGG